MSPCQRFVLFSTTFALFGLSSQGVFAQSLQTAIDAALANEPGLAAIKANVEGEGARLDGARAANKSSLGVQGSFGVSNADFGGGYKAIYPRALALAWEKRIYDGGAALARIEAAEFSLAAKNGQYLDARNRLISETAEAYINLHNAYQGRAYATDALTSMQRFARDAGLQFSAGEVAISEKALAEAALHRAESALSYANGQVQLAVANLYRLTGIQFPQTNAKLDITTKPLNIPANELAAKEIAKSNHPLLASAKASLAASEAQLRIANSANKPSVSVSARASSIRDQFLAGYKSDDVGAYINVSMPLWDNGRVASEQSGARANRDLARANLRSAERNIEMLVANAYINYDIQRAAVLAGKASLEASEVAFKGIQAQTRVGEKPISDLLEAQAKLTAAQSEFSYASSALILARYKIMQAIGAEY